MEKLPFILAAIVAIAGPVKIILDEIFREEKMTNADRYFRNATNEEIAEIIAEDWCELIDCESAPFCDGECKERILVWLQQEADS